MKKSEQILFFCGIIMLVSEIWKQFCLTFIINMGSYDWWYFPFQLCSIPMYICLLLPITKSFTIRQAMLTFLMDFGLLGGIFAFFDTSGMHYQYAPLTVHSFTWHFVLIFIGFTAGLSGSSSGTLKAFINSTSIYLICCALATLVNLSLNGHTYINMFFINPQYKMPQKIFSSFANMWGNTWAILIYITTTISGAAVLHLGWRKINSQIKKTMNGH